jgi:hypothetical protein
MFVLEKKMLPECSMGYNWVTLFLALQVGEISSLRQQNMVMSPTGLRPEKNCVVEAQQQL